MAHPQIAAFARLAKKNTAPKRVLGGQATKLSRTMHDIRYDAMHDEIVVGNPFAGAILVFRGAAKGEEPPLRVIQGPQTGLTRPDRLDIDPIHDEIFVPNRNNVLVFRRNANGDVAPIRVISGPETHIRVADSARAGATAIAVDPVHDLIVVGESAGESYPDGALLIFGRTDNGNVKPRAIIRGPSTGIISVNQITINPSKGWIVVPTHSGEFMEPEGAFVGIWNIQDNGDVPARWKIGGPKSTLKKPRGVALNPKNKELIVADMRLNSVFTFYFPELF